MTNAKMQVDNYKKNLTKTISKAEKMTNSRDINKLKNQLGTIIDQEY